MLGILPLLKVAIYIFINMNSINSFKINALSTNAMDISKINLNGVIYRIGPDNGVAAYGKGVGNGEEGGEKYLAINQIPEGYYRFDESCVESDGFNWSPEVRIKSSKFFSDMNINPDIIKYGVKLCDYMDGTFTEDGHINPDQMAKDCVGYAKGNRVVGILEERGQYQYGNRCGGGNDNGTEYFAINAIPEGIYRSYGADWAPEARVKIQEVINYLNTHGYTVTKN